MSDPTGDRVGAELRQAVSELAMQADPAPDFEELSTAVITPYSQRKNVMKHRTILAAAAVLILIAVAAVALSSRGDDDGATVTAGPTPTAEDGDAAPPASDPQEEATPEPDTPQPETQPDTEEIVAAARTAIGSDTELALLLAAEAYGLDPTPDTAGVLFDVLRSGRHQVVSIIENASVADLYPSPDNETAIGAFGGEGLYAVGGPTGGPVESPIDGLSVAWFNQDGSIFLATLAEPSVGQRIDGETFEVLNDDIAAWGAGQVTPDGDSMLVPSDRGLQELDLASNQITRVNADVPAGFAEITEDGTHVVVTPATEEGSATVVDLESFEIVADHPIAQAATQSNVRLLGNGTHMAATSFVGGTIDIIEIATGETVGSLPGDRRYVGEDVTTVDGFLTTVDRSNFQVALVEPLSGRFVGEPIELLVPAGIAEIEPVELSPDGTRLFVRPTNTDTSTWEVWSVDVAEWTTLACAAAGRELTDDERLTYGLEGRQLVC